MNLSKIVNSMTITVIILLSLILVAILLISKEGKVALSWVSLSLIIIVAISPILFIVFLFINDLKDLEIDGFIGLLSVPVALFIFEVCYKFMKKRRKVGSIPYNKDKDKINS